MADYASLASVVLCDATTAIDTCPTGTSWCVERFMTPKSSEKTVKPPAGHLKTEKESGCTPVPTLNALSAQAFISALVNLLVSQP